MGAGLPNILRQEREVQIRAGRRGFGAGHELSESADRAIPLKFPEKESEITILWKKELLLVGG